MRYVTVVGNQRSGKTSLCLRFSGQTTSDSYAATIITEHMMIEGLHFHDTPGLYLHRVELYYGSTDVFLLVVDKDLDLDPWHARISPVIPTANWFMICNATGPFPKREAWARAHDIPFRYADIQTGNGVPEAFTALRSLAMTHPARIPRTDLSAPYSLRGVVYHWMSCT